MSSPNAYVEPLEKHQLAGIDPHERGFTRPVALERLDGGYRAALRYEAVKAEGDVDTSQTMALRRLIDQLHARGYRQLRTQLSFRGPEYLGSREVWVEYEDPAPPIVGWWARLRQWCGRGNPSSSDRPA